MFINRKKIEHLRNYVAYKFKHRKKQILFFDFWDNQPESNWFYKFIDERDLLRSKPGIRISFYSVCGDQGAIKFDRADVRVFFTGENLHKFSNGYLNHGYSAGVDLALGFDDLDRPDYNRFPLWMLYFINANAGYADVRKFCQRLNSPIVGERPYFATLVARHDRDGNRFNIVKAIEKIDFVHCAGIWSNNTNLLNDTFKDNKKEFLKLFKFNICPENSNSSGYVTEKIFQAFASGCIPIYTGSDNHPEPGIINPEAVIFWDMKGNNDKVISLVEQLHRSPALYKEFIHQPRLLPSAADKIYQFIENLEISLVNLIHDVRSKK